MKIVVDTNVIISGVFFNGLPNRFLKEIALNEIEIVASEEIIKEYYDISKELVESKTGHFNKALFDIIVGKMEIIVPQTKVDVCRDPDDNKFIECAIDGEAIFIVSGDQDLLTIEQYQGVLIVSVADYYSEILCEPIK